MSSGTTDRKFMEQAVEEMLKSRSEHTEKRDPMVGAVIVGPNGVPLGVSFRGDLRVGDHAEFTLIERYLRDKQLDEATLYVTLEPCIKRNPTKKPCAERIVKARIHRVFIGMTDPNPDISGRGIQYLQKHGVHVQFFDGDLVQQIMEKNRGFIEYYEQQPGQSTATAKKFEGPSDQEMQLLPHTSIDDLSREAMARYVEHRQLRIKVPSKQLWDWLEKAGHLGRTTAGKQVPTVAGLVLFGAAPADILPKCRVAIEAIKGGRAVNGDYEGSLMGFRDHLDGFFKDNMRHFTEIKGFDRVKVGEYPGEALRESAFNAVIHRDYKPGARVHITLKEDEVEIRSPGGLLEPVELAQVRAFNAPPFSRNPHIAAAIQRMGWIDEKGSGLTRMRDSMVEHGLRTPLFDVKDGYFIVTLPGQGRAWTGVRIDASFLGTLASPQQAIVRILLEQKRISTNDCITKIGMGDGTARRHLRRLRELGIIEPKGEGAAQHYVLVGA